MSDREKLALLDALLAAGDNDVSESEAEVLYARLVDDLLHHNLGDQVDVARIGDYVVAVSLIERGSSYEPVDEFGSLYIHLTEG